MDIKILVEAHELVKAINNLADAMRSSGVDIKAQEKSQDNKKEDEVFSVNIPDDQLVKGAGILLRTKKGNELKKLLQEFGCDNISAIPNARREEFLSRLTELKNR